MESSSGWPGSDRGTQDMNKNGMRKVELADELVRTRQRIAGIARKDSHHPGSEENTRHNWTAAKDYPSGDGMAIAKDGALLYVNGRFLEIFGYESGDEVVGRPVSIMAHPDEREKVSTYVRSGGHGGIQPAPQEFQGARKDGTSVLVEACTVQTSFGGESVSHIYVRDVTGRKQTIEALEARLRLEELVSAVSTALVDVGGDEIDERIEDVLRTMGMFAGADGVYLALFSSKDALSGRGYSWRQDMLEPHKIRQPRLLPLLWIKERLAEGEIAIIPGPDGLPSDAGAEREAWKALDIASALVVPLSSSGRLTGCLLFSSTGGSMRWEEENVVAIKLVAGIMAGALARCIRDASDLKAARQAWEESESRFTSLSEQSAMGIFLIQDNVFRYVNDRFAAIFGCSAAEIVDRKGLEDLASPEDRSGVGESLRRGASGNGESLHCEFTGIRKDGETVSVEAYGSLVKYRTRPAIIGTLLDESDRKKLEAQLLQSEKMKAIGTLAGGIAHDFNNILMAIQGYTSLMLHHLDSSHKYFGKLQGIEELVESGSDLTKQLLGFASGGTYEIRPTDVNEILRKTSTMFARTKKEISIQSRYENDPCVVDADSGQIERMLLNLYVNAWQAMPEGGSLVLATENVTLDRKFVRPYSAKPGKYTKISVTDSGIGMDEATRERIFEPFFTTKKRAMGTGLGLSSVYNIVKGHNGIITVASEKGRGSTFCVYLPRSKRTVEKMEPASSAVLKGEETILLVDDEETVVSVSRDMLEALGYSVLVARSGQEAVGIFEKEHNRIDLVILDVIMPDMGGAETFEEMQKIDQSAKVVLSSGYSLDSLANKIMDRGCKAFIQKPFTISVLSQKLREVLEKE
jgi:two-component system, cell cycle sensor histidine kinase and response regulator CckA